MRLKRTFIVINIFVIILTTFLVSYNFFKGLKSGDELYKDLYTFASIGENDNFKNRLMECCQITDDNLSSRLDEEQINYLYELHTTIERLDDIQINLTKHLIDNKKKSTSLFKAKEKLDELKIEKNKLLEDFTIYKIKLSGNISGDPEGTFSIFTENILTYIENYSKEITILNDYINKDLNLITNVEHDIIDSYLNAVTFLSKNFSSAHFKSNSFKTIKNINTRVVYVYGNLDLNPNINGGIYSLEGNKFSEYYRKIDKSKFIKNYINYLGSVTNIVNVDDELKITFYYFNNLVRS